MQISMTYKQWLFYCYILLDWDVFSIVFALVSFVMIIVMLLKYQ